MKNQYFGDINDFYKYGLLRFLSDKGNIAMRTAVCWMLTGIDERAHGMDVDYLRNPDDYERHDLPLFRFLYENVPVELKRVIQKEKNATKRIEKIKELVEIANISIVENSKILPYTVFNGFLENGAFDYITPENKYEYLLRFKKIVEKQKSDLVFFDPDTGMLVCKHDGIEKYIALEEMAVFSDYSLLIFQYSRSNLKSNPIPDHIKTNLDKLKFMRGGDPLHLFITNNLMFILSIHPSYKHTLLNRIEAFKQSSWHKSGLMEWKEY